MARRRRRVSWPSTCAPTRPGGPRCTRPARSTRTPGPTSWRRAPPKSTGSRCTAMSRPTGACPTSTASTGSSAWRPAWRTLEQGRRWVDYNGPVSPQLVDAVVAPRTPTSSPSIRTCTTRPWRTIGKVQVPAVLHPAAHDEPALYLPVFRGTFGDADAFCFHTASERDLVERMYPVAERPQIVLGLGVGESEGPAGPGATCLGLGDRPYVVSVGRVDEHKGSKMLASYFATYKERHPGPLALVLVGPVSLRAGAAPRHRGDRRGRASPTSGTSCATRWWRSRRRPSSRSRWWSSKPGWTGSRSSSTGPAGRPGSTPSAPGAGCGSRPTPNSRRCSDRLVSDAAAARHARRAWARLRRPAFPVAGADRALRRVPHDRGGAGQGHAGPVLTRTRPAAHQKTGRPTTVYIGWSMALLPMSWARWWRCECRVVSVCPKPSRSSMETTAPG